MLSVLLVRWLFFAVLQEPWGFGERAGRSAGCPGGLPGFSSAGPRLFHWHLGLSVLPRHCKLPVFLTKGEYLTKEHSIVRLDPKKWNGEPLLHIIVFNWCAETHDNFLF